MIQDISSRILQPYISKHSNNQTLKTVVLTKPVGGLPEGTTGIVTGLRQHSCCGIAGVAASSIGCCCGTSTLCWNSLADSCTTVTDIQSLSAGQQPCSNGITSDVFPVQAHFVTPMPPAPNTNSISVVRVIAMFETSLISRGKNTTFVEIFELILAEKNYLCKKSQ